MASIRRSTIYDWNLALISHRAPPDSAESNQVHSFNRTKVSPVYAYAHSILALPNKMYCFPDLYNRGYSHVLSSPVYFFLNSIHYIFYRVLIADSQTD
ncbi:hypothetical protein FA15DRAFT_369384 [Coprinopsis marcescibilis]|uniref:Uncharacterized protein n=1 Tax=Coprinopsis marcescibilis TaxID=230819 RepID=A0A5C3KY34_COPMA|nr:hypothetical protein FA15DRAFT_369384 [Coprinopsis marcescibilis]